MKKRMWLVILVVLLVSTVAVAGVVKKTFDDCGKEGLQHSWVYSVPEDFSSFLWHTSTGSITFNSTPKFVEVQDNNAGVQNWDKVIRARHCRNCQVVEELHQTHKEGWERK
jgi:hypothetical protein